MVILVMGVMGSGKTALGRALARGLGARFFDADDAHSPDNRDRMARGEPLRDDEREPWLREVGRVIAEPQRRKHLVVACSALCRRHRELLRGGCPELRLVFLHPSLPTLRQRLELRRGHFASPTLLESQLDMLEPPDASERAIFVDNEEPVETVAARLLSALVLDLDDAAVTGPRN